MTTIPTAPNPARSRARAPWLQLAIAPQAQARLRFAAPGTLERGLLPMEALELISHTQKQGMAVEMVELAGPGDPLATPELTLECVRAIRDRYPGLAITVSTLGLGIGPMLAELVSLGVRINLQVDAVRPGVVAEIFRWIRPQRKTLGMARVAPLLVAEQAKAITACSRADLTLTISTTVYPNHNHEHIEEIARTVADLGATTMVLQPFMPCGIEGEPAGPGSKLLAELTALASRHLSLATAPLYISTPPDGIESGCPAKTATLPKARKGRANVAVLSGNGMDIDLHLGQAIKALIYGPRQDGLTCLLEARNLPEPGTGDSRWQKVAATLDDCFVLLAASVGPKPREILGRSGLALVISGDEVEGSVDMLFGGGKKGRCKNRAQNHPSP